MSKTIVGPGEVATDPKLAIVKKFRSLNKKAGDLGREIKIARQDNPDDVGEMTREYGEIIKQMNILAQEASAAGFNIWINPNGKTGHTYENDYKESADEDNSVEARDAAFTAADIARRDYALRIARLMARLMAPPSLN